MHHLSTSIDRYHLYCLSTKIKLNSRVKINTKTINKIKVEICDVRKYVQQRKRKFPQAGEHVGRRLLLKIKFLHAHGGSKIAKKRLKQDEGIPTDSAAKLPVNHVGEMIIKSSVLTTLYSLVTVPDR